MYAHSFSRAVSTPQPLNIKASSISQVMRDFHRRIPQAPGGLITIGRDDDDDDDAAAADADADALLGSADIYAAINGRLLKNLGRANARDFGVPRSLLRLMRLRAIPGSVARNVAARMWQTQRESFCMTSREILRTLNCKFEILLNYVHFPHMFAKCYSVLEYTTE